MVNRRELHRAFSCAFLVLLIGASACQSSSKCGSGGIMPAEGSATDFHTQPAVYDGFEVQAPVSCTGLRTLLVVTGLGTQTFWMLGAPCRNEAKLDAGGLDACGPTLRGVLDEARQRLGAQGVYTAEIGWGVPQATCDSGQVLPLEYLHLEGWQDADAAVTYVGEALRKRDLRESATVIVEPVIVNCPS